MFKSFAVLAATAYATETIVFEDTFDTFDFTKWQHEITLGGGGNNEFEMYLNNRKNSWVENGVLYLQPTLTADEIGANALTSRKYSIWGTTPADLCTGNMWNGCERTGTRANILNPIQSARLRTVNSFNFKYGRVEVRAQLPKGDWIWPAIWMLPTYNEYGTWPASGEIDIMESRGNSGAACSIGSKSYGSTLHWGPSWDQNRYYMTNASYTNNVSLGDDFHTYGLVWTETTLYTYIDDPNNKVLNVDMSTTDFWTKGGFSGLNPWRGGGRNAPFDKNFYLVLNVAVGGTNGYFPDGQCSKPWSNGSSTAATDFWNAKNSWYPTWNYPATNQAAMKVDSVRVWRFDP